MHFNIHSNYQRSYPGSTSHLPNLILDVTSYSVWLFMLRSIAVKDFPPISLPFNFFHLECSPPYVRQRSPSSGFCETHRAAAFLLPSAFIIRCRATRRDECLLPVIYRSLFLLATHLRSSARARSPFPLRCVPFVSPGPPPTRALINFLDGAHYRPDCRQIPTPRRDT